MNITNEKAFEEAIEQSLLEKGGYSKGDPNNYNRARKKGSGLDKTDNC